MIYASFINILEDIVCSAIVLMTKGLNLLIKVDISSIGPVYVSATSS